jgi:hypothetical protein
MLLLATLVFLVVIVIALIIGGLGIVITGGLGILFAAMDVLVGGFILWIPIHCIKKHKKKKGDTK